MKKLLLLLLIPIYMFGLVLNQDVVDNYVKKEQVIRDYIITYLYEQGKLPEDKTILKNYFNLDDNLFTNVYGEVDAITFNTTDNGITLYNIINTNVSEINDNIKNYYTKSVYQNNLIEIANDYSSNFLVYNSETKNVINFINNLLDFEYVGTVQPTDLKYTSWYYPNGDGTFTLRKFDGTNWYLTNYDTSTSNYSYDESSFNIDEQCTNNDTANVYTTKGIINYICIDGSWTLKTDSSGDNTLFNGYADLHSLVCNMWSKAGTSTVYDVPVLPFTGTLKNFTKYDDSDVNHEGYWISDDFKDMVTKNMKDLIWYRAKYNTQTTGYMCFNNKVIISKWIGVNNNNQWVYLTSNYLDMYDNYKIDITDWNNNNNYLLSWNYYDSRNGDLKKIFQLNNNIYKSKYKYDNGSNAISDIFTQLGYKKSSFTDLVDDTYYLTKIDNCSVDKDCYGSINTQFNGNMIDNMYLFLYDIYSKKMVDARLVFNLSDIYTLMNNAVYYNKDIYYKKKDINNQVCYQREDGKWITDELFVIPDMYITENKPNFPVGINCQNVKFTTDNVIILDNRDMLANWFKAPKNIIAKVNGINYYYTKKEEGEKDYWSNIIENISGNSRYDLPYVNNNNKIYITKYLGTKDNLNDTEKLYRFSDNGLKYNIDNNFYMWFAANTTKSINNMIDGNCANIHYTSNVCNLQYNNKQFKFNNNRCETDINDKECPIVDRIQTIYDSGNDNCYIPINEDNQFCNDKTMIYSKSLDKCYHPITDQDCENTKYTYNDGSGECRSTIDFSCTADNNCQTLINNCNSETEFDCINGLATQQYWNCTHCNWLIPNSSYKTKFKLTPVDNYYYVTYHSGNSNHEAYTETTMLSKVAFRNDSTETLWIQIDSLPRKGTSWDGLYDGSTITDDRVGVEIKPGEEFGFGYKSIAWGSKKNLTVSSGFYSSYDHKLAILQPSTKPYSYIMDKNTIVCPSEYLVFKPAEYSEGGDVNTPSQYYCDYGDKETCTSDEVYNCFDIVRDVPSSCIDTNALVSDNTYYCYKDLSINHQIELNSIYGDIFVSNLDFPTNMTFNSNLDRFETPLNILNVNNITKGDNFKNIPTNLNLYYDTNNNKIFYTPDNSICQSTKMDYDIKIDTPFYPYYDGNCYSEIGKACYDSGFSNIQSVTY